MALTPDQLFKRQQQMNMGLQAASGASALLGQGMGMINEAKQIRTTAPTQLLDAFGKPMYNLGDFTSQVSAIKPQGAQGGELLSGALQGAAGGAAFSPIGAGVGALVGLASTALFGRRRKTLQREKQRLANKSLFNAQRMYNQSMESYNAQQAAQSLYRNQSEISQGRINNVYQALS